MQRATSAFRPVPPLLVELGLLVGASIVFVSGLMLQGDGTQRLIERLNSIASDGAIDDNYVYMLSAADGVLLLVGGVGLVLGLVLLLGKGPLVALARSIGAWSSSRFLLAFATLSLLINFGLLLVVPFEPWDDYAWYHTRATAIAAGEPIVRNGLPTAYLAIGYAMFLAPFYAVFGANVIVAQILNIVLRLVIAIAAYDIGRQASRNEAVGRVSFLIVVLFPSLLFYSLVSCSDVLFTAIALLILWLMMRMDWLSFGRTLLLGLLVGAGSHVRPVLLLFPLVILFWYVMVSRRPILSLLHVVILVGLQALLLAPWTYRNYEAFGQLVLVSTNSGYNLYLGNNPLATGGFNPYGHPRPDGNPNEAERDAWYRDQAIAYIREDPARAAALLPRKLLFLFMRDDQGLSSATKATYQQVAPPLLLLSLVISNLYYAGVMLLAAGFVLWNGWRLPRDRRMLLLLAYLVYHVAIYLPYFGADRYHVPLLPVLSMLAAGAIAYPAGATTARGKNAPHAPGYGMS